MLLLRKIFQWAVSFVLLGLGFLYLLTAGRYFFFQGDPDADSLRDAGVSLSLAVALFGLGAVNFWVFGANGDEVTADEPPGGDEAAVEK